MNVNPYSSITVEYLRASNDLAWERQKRDTLKRFIAIAHLQNAPKWIHFFSEELHKSRRRINRLSARQSRLRHRLAR